MRWKVEVVNRGHTNHLIFYDETISDNMAIGSITLEAKEDIEKWKAVIQNLNEQEKKQS